MSFESVKRTPNASEQKWAKFHKKKIEIQNRPS